MPAASSARRSVSGRSGSSENQTSGEELPQVRVQEGPARVELATNRYELVRLRVQRVKPLRPQEVELAPMDACVELVEQRIHRTQVIPIVGARLPETEIAVVAVR